MKENHVTKKLEESGAGGRRRRRVKCESGKYETCQSDFATEEATWAEQEEKQSTWNSRDFSMTSTPG